MTNLAKYDWKTEDADKEREESEAAGSGNFLKLKVGRSTVRVLPPKPGKKSPFRVAYKHFIDLPGTKLVFTCPRMEKKGSCPACARVDDLRATGNQADYDLAGEILAQRQVYCNVIDRADPEKGVQILRLGKQLHEQLLALRSDESTGGNFTHPLNGFDVVIDRTGQGKNDTRYTLTPSRSNSPLADDATIAEQWLEGMHDLEALCRLPSDEDLQKLAPRRAAAAAPPPRGRAGAPRQAAPARGARTAADDSIDTDGEDVTPPS